jgi:hypothetical protein
MRTDRSKLGELSPDFGGSVDTEAIGMRIDSLVRQNSSIRAWINSYMTLLPGAAVTAAGIWRVNQWTIESLREKLWRAQRYLGDTGIYAASQAEAAALSRATRALGEVFFNTAIGSFDLSRVGDWSWRSKDLERRYWTAHNQRVVDQYFTRTSDGMLVPTPAFLELMARLAPYISDPSTNISDIEGTLSPEEKYALFYLVLDIHDDVYDFGYEQYINNPGGVEAFWRAYDLARPFLGGQYDIPGITDFVAFMGSGDHFSSSDRPGTIQSEAGFMDFYDPAVSLLGMQIDTKIVVFQSGGKEYRVQLWDGSYGWGGFIGGEVGIYCRDASLAKDRPYIHDKDLSPEGLRAALPSMTADELDNYFINYQCVPEGEQFPMVLEIYTQDGVRLIKNDTRDYANNGDHYWNFATERNSKAGYAKEDVYISVKIEVEDDAVRQDMMDAFIASGVDVNTSGDTLNLTWGNE